MLRLVVPDFVSPSYFPAIAAHQLGYFADEHLDVDLTLRFPVTDAAVSLRDGDVDFIAGAAHAPMYAFPAWEGATVLMALSQKMYWFLVTRSDLEIPHGDLARVKGLRIGAAPGPVDGLRALLLDAGVEPSEVGIQSVPVSSAHGTSFGLAAAEALANGSIDGFWANGMGAEVATRNGTGTVIYDARRDTTYPQASLVTFPALVTRRALAEQSRPAVEGMIRAVCRAQRDLAADPSLATHVAATTFPPYEASLIEALIERDAPFYRAEVSHDMTLGVARLGRLSGQQVPDPPTDIVWEHAPGQWA